jgi:hypothetical protein
LRIYSKIHKRQSSIRTAFGFGLMVLIGSAGGGAGNALGIGGFLAVIGLAFFINSLIDNWPEPPLGPLSGPGWTAPAPPPEQRSTSRNDA